MAGSYRPPLEIGASSARWMSLSDTFLNADFKNRGTKTEASAPGGGYGTGAPKP